MEGNLLRQPGLAEIMAGLAAGDMVAFTWLIEVHRGDLERTVRKLAADRYSRLSAEDVDELVATVGAGAEAVAELLVSVGGALAQAVRPSNAAHNKIHENIFVTDK